MPDDSIPAPEVEPQAISVSNVSGGVNLDAQRDVNIGGDVVGRDKIVSYQGYTVEQVSTLLTQISSTFQPKPFDGRCPYLGLANYDEDTADLFFGCERLAAELVDRVRVGVVYTLKHGENPKSGRCLTDHRVGEECG